MKVALLTDTHWGVRENKRVFHENFKKFLDQTFFPYCEEHDINTLIHLGDLVHERRQIGGLTLSALRNDFLIPLKEKKWDCYFIVGNHDCFWTNTNVNNAQREIVAPFGFKVIDEIDEIKLGKQKLLLISWINKSNNQTIFEAVKKSKANVVLGHFEFSGFPMYKGHDSKEGLSPKLFDKFHLVCSGHFHTPSKRDNVVYLGSMGQYTWADYPDKKGFYILDTESLELTFIENPFNMFEVVKYPSSASYNVTDKYVRIDVESRESEQDFEKFVKALEEQGPISILIRDNIEIKKEDLEEESQEGDNLSIIQNIVMSSSIEHKEEVTQLITEVYLEALNVNF